MRFIQTTNPDSWPTSARWFIDGKRVTKEYYDFMLLRCEQKGMRLNSSYTQGQQLRGGRIKRRNVMYYN